MKLKGSEISKLVRVASKLKASEYTDVKVEVIERKHRKMVPLYKEDEHVKTVIDGSAESFTLSEAWKPFIEKINVKEFCGGLCTSFSSTASGSRFFENPRRKE